MEVNFPESYVEMTLTGINTTRSVSRQVNQDLILEHNFADLVPGTTYEITLEPRFEDLWGDQVKLKITTRLGELTFECFEILRNTSSKNENSENEDYEAEKTGNFENDLEKFANVKCLVSIDGRFDNITDTIEPPFSAQFQIFASNYLELDFTQLTPGETYRYSVNIKAGPWSLRSYQRVPTIPARPVLFLFKVYIDNTIELRFLLNGKGISFTYQIFDRNIIIATRVEAFEKYKFLIIDPKFYGMTLIAFVSTEEAVSDKAQRILKEISFFNVLSATIQRETDFYLSVNYTVNSPDLDRVLIELDPDPNPGVKTISHPNSKTNGFLLHPFFCGNNTMLSMTPYDDYTRVGPKFETELSTEPCPLFSHIEYEVSASISTFKTEIVVTIPFKGEIVDIKLHFAERQGRAPDFTVASKKL